MSAEKQQQWKNRRAGFKHELVVTLVDSDFSYREAEKIVNTIFTSIKEALLRKDEVAVEGFGRWRVKELPQAQRRKWRFGKVIILKRYEISFEIERGALLQAGRAEWNPHPSWQARRSKKPKLRGRKLALFLQQQEKERHEMLLTQYARLILKFFQHELRLQDVQLFWTLRHGSWFYGAVSEIPRGLML